MKETADDAQVIEKMERETGFEPATSSLGSWHSTTELLPLSRQYKYSISNHLRIGFKTRLSAWESSVLPPSIGNPESEGLTIRQMVRGGAQTDSTASESVWD